MLIEIRSRGRGVGDTMDVIWVLEGETTRDFQLLKYLPLQVFQLGRLKV